MYLYDLKTTSATGTKHNLDDVSMVCVIHTHLNYFPKIKRQHAEKRHNAFDPLINNVIVCYFSIHPSNVMVWILSNL